VLVSPAPCRQLVWVLGPVQLVLVWLAPQGLLVLLLVWLAPP
jgi:hypothetical protein